ncbi:hypothetical protein [Streptomyces sp. NPDC091371]|uniref:hypothetical protein n=1 Tax=Streptomyces sp. NPDC091371 TaxID=3155303 RepID=UPI003421815D
MTRLRAVAAGAALLSPLLLTGCGIKPTGPVDSGAAATVAVIVPEDFSVLYFLSPEGRLVPSPQRDIPRVTPIQVLTRLLDGPGQRELEAGLATEVPSVHGKRLDPSVISMSGRDAMTVRLPFAVQDLTPTARRQLVCSLASTGSSGNRYTVALQGTDTTLAAEACDDAAERPSA